LSFVNKGGPLSTKSFEKKGCPPFGGPPLKRPNYAAAGGSRR